MLWETLECGICLHQGWGTFSLKDYFNLYNTLCGPYEIIEYTNLLAMAGTVSFLCSFL